MRRDKGTPEAMMRARQRHRPFAGTGFCAVAALGLPFQFLSACASGPGYAEYLQRWQGASRAKLIGDWGPPDYRFRDHKGRQALQYIYYEVIFESLSSGRRIVWWCQTTFALGAQDLVAATTITGNHCFPPKDLAAERARRLTRRGPPPFVPPSE